MKLNLGSSGERRIGFENVDCREEVCPDILMDLNVLPWSFANNSIEDIIAHEVIEHLTISPEEFIKECFRILAPGGRLNIIVPNCFHIKTRLQILFGRIPFHGYCPFHTMFTKPSYILEYMNRIGFWRIRNMDRSKWHFLGLTWLNRDLFSPASRFIGWKTP